MLQVGDKSLSLNDLKAQFQEKKITVEEPHMKGAVELIGFDFIQILDTQLPNWKKADGILVTALDGYKSDVSVAKILKYKPTLAFKFTKQSEFKIDNKLQNEKDVDLGPYYLVWDNISNPMEF
jgi:hypothetical protein